MTILHLATWFPSEKNEVSGIFVQKHIEAISKYDKSNNHIVISLNHVFTSITAPLKFATFFFKKMSLVETRKETYTLIEPSFFVTHKYIGGDVSIQLYKQVLQILETKGIRPGMIHAHVTYTAGSIARMLKQKTGTAYIISEHMSPFPFLWMKKQPFLDRYIKSVTEDASEIVAVSNHLKKEMIKHVTNPKKIAIIGNVVDSGQATSKSSRGEGIHFILVGMLTKAKGVDILIEAVSLLHNKCVINFVIDIAGDGPLRTELKKLAIEKNVDSYFNWLGLLNHNELINSIQKSDAFICASRHESFGVAIVEALACGKPVIATDCGGPSDTIDNTNGIIVENESPAALATGIEYMLQNLKNYDASIISDNAKQKFSPAAIASQYLALYQRIK